MAGGALRHPVAQMVGAAILSTVAGAALFFGGMKLVAAVSTGDTMGLLGLIAPVVAVAAVAGALVGYFLSRRLLRAAPIFALVGSSAPLLAVAIILGGV